MPYVSRAETVRTIIYYGIHRMARWSEPYSPTPLFAYGVDIAFSGYKTFIASRSWRRRQVFIVLFIRMAGALTLRLAGRCLGWDQHNGNMGMVGKQRCEVLFEFCHGVTGA